jgi:hypothetical protein
MMQSLVAADGRRGNEVPGGGTSGDGQLKIEN